MPLELGTIPAAWATASLALAFHRDGEPIRDFQGVWRTAVRNLERAGVSRFAAMAMVGHRTEFIYRRYAIVNAGALRDAAAKIDDAVGHTFGHHRHEHAVNR